MHSTVTSATHPGVPCTDVLKSLSHTVMVSFTQPGDAVIRIWGRLVGPNTPSGGQPIVLEHHVVVQ